MDFIALPKCLVRQKNLGPLNHKFKEKKHILLKPFQLRLYVYKACSDWQFTNTCLTLLSGLFVFIPPAFMPRGI